MLPPKNRKKKNALGHAVCDKVAAHAVDDVCHDGAVYFLHRVARGRHGCVRDPLQSMIKSR
jgi:hypothetical protein